MFTEDITAIVVDVGSLTARAGYSGEDTPRIVMSSQLGLIEGQQNMMQMEQEVIQNKDKVYFIGDSQIRQKRDNMQIINSFSKGQICDLDAYGNLIMNVYDKIRTNPKEYSLMLSEPSIHNQKQREQLCEWAFEKLQVPNLFIAKSGVLSCFSSGRSTALILDTGAYSTYAVPIYDGYAMQKSIVKYDIAGEFLTEMLINYVECEKNQKIFPRYRLEHGINKETAKKIVQYLECPNVHNSFDQFSKLEIIRDLKETVCRVDEKGLSSSDILQEKTDYELPDGSTLTFDTARSEFCEYFFTRQRKDEKSKDKVFTPPQLQMPELLNFKGVHHMVLDAINSCDLDIKKELFQNIILTGGNSLLAGFSSRLQTKLNDVAPPNSRVKMIAYPSPIERKFSTWIGGSILASLGSFQSLWVGKSEFDEQGSFIIEKKCP